MRTATLLFLLLLAASFVQAQRTYSNIDDLQSGWGSCSSCAGGANVADVWWMAQNQTSPSLDGGSTQFYMSASKPYADVLFYNKLGPNNSATQFTWDFWFQVDSASLNAEALEFDIFQFIVPTEYMFGSQCTYSTGQWDVWNAGIHKWVPVAVPCPRFTANVWHHIVWQVHRTRNNKMMHYDTLTIDGTKYTVGVAEPSGALPAGWSDMMGVQWQLDGPGNPNLLPISFNEWIDQSSLKVR